MNLATENTNTESKFNSIIEFIKEQFPNQPFIPLHAPVFIGNERDYLINAIDSTFVSSVGEYVNEFERQIAKIAGTKFAVATVNGTAALHIALIIAGVERSDEVISQALTFIATANAISYVGADPIFIDVDKDTLGMSPVSLKNFLNTYAEVVGDNCYNKLSGKRIKACVPMHTFGLPLRIDEIRSICDDWKINLIEDAAESLGSYYKNKHTGSFGKIGTFSFNGNKVITCGGGGAIVTDDEEYATLAKHLTTQAKIPHKWEFNHDSIGYNYRMPNINAALACAQLEQLESFVINKRDLAEKYHSYFTEYNISYVKQIPDAESNYWLNALLFKDREERDLFLESTNNNGVMTRPVWTLMNKLPMFKDCFTDGLVNSQWLEDRLVNIPSSVRI